MALEDYIQKFVAQRERCAICEMESQIELRVDHNHTTGQNRGLLCHTCNLALGLIEARPDFVRRANAYLEKYRLANLTSSA
jgi:hypothetical protein